VTVFTLGPPVISGVDTVLRTLTTEALKGLATPVGVVVGPLDRPVAGPRLNWFLYAVAPSAALANMEPPQVGWRTRRGRPPLALTLHYLLSADAGELSDTGSEDDVVHAALSALMSALHDNGIFGLASLIASGPDRTVADVTDALDALIEPLRITLETVPLESITALWNSGSHALRLSVGYQVSLVIVPAQTAYVAGPPVQVRRVAVSPALIPAIVSVTPTLVSFDDELTVLATGVADTHAVTLGRLPGDPDDPTDGRPNPATTHSTGPWKLATVPVSGGFTTHLPNGELAPGRRPLIVTNVADGLPAGSGQAVVTVVPFVVAAAAPLQAGLTATLTVRHVVGLGDAFFGGQSAPYEITGPDSVQALVPALPATATVPVSLRVGTKSGPATDLAVGP
jgi:hypothetical protein